MPTPIDEQRITELVQRVVADLRKGQTSQAPAQATAHVAQRSATAPPAMGCFATVDAAVQAAAQAYRELDALPLRQRYAIVDAMRRAARDAAVVLASEAQRETRMGRVEDKVQKNLLVAEKTPGPEQLEPVSYTGNHGLTLVERAPYGVIGAITPSTNPTSTIICNAIGMISAGNAVTFNAHPAAKHVSVQTVDLLNQAIVRAGGPRNLVTTVAEPTIEGAQELMKHPAVRLLVVTGGPGVVKVAMSSGKKAVCAGPGNPPVVVDETADIDKAAADIVTGASFDNNIVCILEKEIIAVDSIADSLKAAMRARGVVEISAWQLERLMTVILSENRGPGCHGFVNKDWVGKSPSAILAQIGVSVPDSVRLVLAEVDRLHPLVWTEQLMPVIPLVRVPTADDAIDLAVAAEQGMSHTAMMHSRHLDHLSRMARVVNTSIFVKNAPSLAGLGYGGEGFTSFSIATPTGEGLTCPLTFSRIRRCTLVDSFRIV